MTAEAYRSVIAAPERERLGLFLATAQRLGTPLANVEKDFWVCWTLEALYHGLPAGGPRLLFKGGTSLSKAYGLIERFSEDIDVTVFRDDLGQTASVEVLEALSKQKRRAKLDAIRAACRAYVTGPLLESLGGLIADATGGAGRVTIDEADPDGQTLLVRYPSVEASNADYVRPAVRIEMGAKSALDPNRPALIRPYVGEETPELDLAVANVITIEPGRTFWDKIVITHGLRRWYERRGVLRQEGQRVSRHYYDLHCLARSEAGKTALDNRSLGADCVRHARMFFDRPDYDLASAAPGSFAVAPIDGMIDSLRRDYANTAAMIFGGAPDFGEILATVGDIDRLANAAR